VDPPGFLTTGYLDSLTVLETNDNFQPLLWVRGSEILHCSKEESLVFDTLNLNAHIAC